jgi:hypothetical protein
MAHIWEQTDKRAMFMNSVETTFKMLHAAGLAARHTLADWPGTERERELDCPEYFALERLADDALHVAERLRRMHEREA